MLLHLRVHRCNNWKQGRPKFYTRPLLNLLDYKQ